MKEDKNIVHQIADATPSQELDPDFDDTIFDQDDELNNPDTINNHIQELIKQGEPIPHTDILKELIDKIKEIDFNEFAELDNKKKLRDYHYLIETIEQILNIAEENKWGLCMNLHFVYVYNGAYWCLIDTDDLKKFLGEAAEKMGVDKYKARHYNFRDQLYKQFIALAHLPRPEQSKDSVLVNLKNGTFEITPQGTRLREFDPKDFLTYQLPFEYDPKAKTPIFESYLNKVLPDKALQNILSEFLGYIFIQPTTLKLEKALLLYGSGANGKSVFHDIVNSLLGDQNTSQYSMQSLTDPSGYYRASIANKLVNYASEINGKLEASFFKQLVSGEPVEARLPYGNPFTVKQYAKLIFNCNELPRDIEQTEAFFRRFLIVPFDVTISEHEQDTQLAQKIISSELSGVFNWVLQGLQRLLEQKRFTECEAAHDALEKYKNESNSVKVFLDEEGYQASPDAHVLTKMLYHEYRTFCIDNGFRPVNKTNFKKRLQNIGIEVDRKNNGYVAYLIKTLEPF